MKYILTKFFVRKDSKNIVYSELMLFEDYQRVLEFIMGNKSYDLVSYEEVTIVRQKEKKE